MNRRNRLAGMIAAISTLMGAPALSCADDVRVEPPNWWTGFKETELQLQVYGDDASLLRPSVEYPGVEVRRAVTVDDEDYVFVYLDIGADTRPGTFTLVLEGDGRRIEHPYTLERRNPDPAHTAGFDGSDAIYLITPDRFANGDTSNDTLDGFGDPADRADPDGRHGGDIAGISRHLDYIADMGFTAIWLNPLLENRMPEVSYHGYSTTDFYRVDPRFGSNEAYRDLVRDARGRGIGVIMDMIVNHVGSGHWWMADLPAEDWLNHPDEPVITSHIHITEQDPHASEADRRAFSDGWFVTTMPDLNQRNPLLADYLTQNALWWIEYLGLTGIRMDTYPYPDKDYMSEWTRRVMLEYPDFSVVGEEWTENPAAVAYWQRGMDNRDGYRSWLPNLMDFPLQAALGRGLAPGAGQEGLMRLYHALANDFVYPDPQALVVFADNHDMSRIATQLAQDPALFRVAMAYVLTTRGIPQVYYGTEIMMSHPGTDAHGVIRSDFPGGWPGDDRNAFTGEGLDPAELAAQDDIRRLLTWRRDQAVVHHGELTHFVPQGGTYVYFRHDERDSVMVALNVNEAPVSLSLDRFFERLRGYDTATDVMGGDSVVLGNAITLAPKSATILELNAAE